jgi:hypothetical protein
MSTMTRPAARAASFSRARKRAVTLSEWGPLSSASWFETDRLNLHDDFDPVLPLECGEHSSFGIFR